ncbi:helix-turn-helix transcriptional regulator [Fodinicurvata sp. EGI_FJ10296]|uniref:S24 family peptidase n=1 Tax=Fodinicurvata sp. EGI_FJ10296 TaxID=3231908 RepID=UPI0034556117
MFTHSEMWRGIDRLAERCGLSPSGLARLSGLDATAFNPSKRLTPMGKTRWPSTESLAKILAATHTELEDFVGLVQSGGGGENGTSRNTGRGATQRIPIIGCAQAGGDGYFDDAGFPAGTGWDEVLFPDIDDPHGYALEIQGDSMEPVFREGDTIIVSPTSSIRRGDRVVARTVGGEVMAKELARRSATRVELRSFNPAHEPRMLLVHEISWMARIIWASQ